MQTDQLVMKTEPKPSKESDQVIGYIKRMLKDFNPEDVLARVKLIYSDMKAKGW